MTDNKKYVLDFITNLRLDNMKSGINQLQAQLDKLGVPKGLDKSLTKTIEKLKEEIKTFENLTTKETFDKTDVSDIVSSYKKIDKAIRQISISSKELNELSLSNLLSSDDLERFNKLNATLGKLQSLLDFKSTIPNQIKDLRTEAEKSTTSIEELNKELDKLNKKNQQNVTNYTASRTRTQELTERRNALEKAQAELRKPRGVNSPEYAKLQKDIRDAQDRLNKLQAMLQKAEAQVAITENKKSRKNPAARAAERQKAEAARDAAQADFDAQQRKLTEMQQRASSLRSQKTDGTQLAQYKKNADEIEKLNKEIAESQSQEKQYSTAVAETNKEIRTKTAELEKQQKVIDDIEQQITKLEQSGVDQSKVEEIKKEIEELSGTKVETDDLEELKRILENLKTDTVEKAQQDLEQYNNAQKVVTEEGGKVKKVVDDNTKSFERQDAQLKDIDGIKARITAFFGLNNVIQLVRRTVRDAYETIKSLDKAMTETAVVTDFSVGDMWAQLPEYTRRANELGVTTQAVYEAATLYYQQGLKTNEVTALSNETLRMARIAGLEAAEATDRMTNALRGFNMALTEANAQRVDDVYSRLAAISASNVDEISTAMTKVASLAHNAGMEFETTAAFLAQIIETTRESAETAGTALKTVVARFSEVKKLVDENELSGTDEEGEVIDVNRVSQALRTAGIDLNKYFLGEVGIDDIFMELASKWDSLTTMQQRYIATQAAGSRQQSRFIALMSDYARTQELVGEAYNANGAAAKQFAKTQDSLESKLAKLKNAWDQFTMGIANNDLIKWGVDALTTILNIVNQLTSGFGTLNSGVGSFINTFAKLTVLFSGLNVGKGLTGGLLNSTLANLLGRKKVDFGQAVAEAMNVDPGKNLWATLGKGAASPFLKIGKVGKGIVESKAWGFFQKRGLKNPMLGVSGAQMAQLSGQGFFTGAGSIGAGLAGLAPILLGVAAAGTTAYVIIKKLYNESPAGQLKIAEKYAETIRNFADEANNTKRQLTSIQDEYSELSKAVDNADTIEERSEAIKARNEYIKSLLEQNEIYSQYVSRDKIDGEIVLTLDDEKLASAIDKAANQIMNAASHFAQANVVQQRIDALQEEINKIYNGTKQSWIGYDNGSPYTYYTTRDLTDEESGKITQLQMEIDSLRGEMVSYATQGYKQFLSSDLPEATSDFLADILAQSFNGDEFQTAAEKATSFLTTKGRAAKRYKEITGQDAGDVDPKTLKAWVDTLTATELQQETAKSMQEAFLAANFSKQDIADIIDLWYNKGQNIKQSNLTQLPELIGQLAEFLPQEIINQMRGNYRAIYSGDLSPRKASFSSFELGSESLKKIINESSRFSSSELDLSNNQLRTINNLLNDLALTNFDAIPEFSDLLLNLIKATPEDELDSLFSILKSIDLNDAKSIQKAFGLISGLDIDLDSFGYSIDEASNYLIKLSGAVQKLDFEKLQEELSKTVDLLRNVRERDENNRTFSKQEFESIMAAGGNRNDFYYTGISGSEYVYIGDSLDTIVSLLTQQLVTEQENTVHNLQEKVDRGTELVNSDEKIFVNGRELEISEAIVSIASTDFSEGIDQDLVSSLKGSKTLQKIYGDQVLQDMTPEALIEALQILSTTITDLETNQNNLNTAIRDYTEAIKYNTVQPTINWQNDFPTMSSVNGNVDVFNRKQVAFNEENFGSWIPYYKNILHEASDARDEERYAMAQGILEAIQAGDSYATLWSQGISDENGNEFLFTPILPNGEVLSPETFYDYVEQILDSSDALAADATGIEINGKLIQGLLIAALGQNPDYETGQKIHEESEAYYAQDDTSISSKMDTIDAQFNTSENAHLVYDQIRDSIADATEANKAFFDSEAQITTQAQSLSLAWVKQADNLDKLTNTVDKYDSLLTSQEADSLLVSSAIHEIGDAMREAYGAQVTDEFVQAHMEQITLARESAEAYQELLDLLQQEFFANAVQGTENFNQSLYNAQQLMADCIDSGYALSNLEMNGVAYLDDTPWISVIEELLNAGADVKAFFNSLGWTTNIEWDSIEMGTNGEWILPKNIQLVPNNPTGYRGYTPYTGPGYNHNNKSSSSSASNPTPWENELDWLYNLMEDIAELERQQDKLSELHSRYLNDISKTGRDLYDVTREQLNNLYTQRDNQREALTRRRQEMAEQIGVSGYGRYVQWNDKDQTIEIDWNAIEAIKDKDTYDEVNDLISKVEKIQDEMDEASDALFDIEDKIKELEERYLKEFTEFQKRVLDAVVKSYQDSIDHLTELNDTINDTNSAILDSLQKEIDYSRQIRDNTDTENEIADMESRLAYLRRDTTGANETAIRDLEKQLEDARENYSDTLIDQQLERLSEANDQAAEQRQQQIDLMTAQLDYWQESGALWAEVAQLLDEGLNADGSLIRDSSLEQILQNADGWKAMSQQQREVWANELITSANQAGAYLLKISEGLNSLSAGIWAIIPASSVTSQKLQYATGGMNTCTGWAWLDGTANDPEYVLNARQTDAFLRLADVLPSMFEGNNVATNNLGGNVYVELTMNVGEIGSDYDVDRMVERIKTDIYAASSYRNVNAVSFQR